jgi:hypothetical protein
LANREKHPYVLEFGHTSPERRVRRGDLLLMSQRSNSEALIVVVKQGTKLVLAERNELGQWMRLANGEPLASEPASVGFCCGMVWADRTE